MSPSEVQLSIMSYNSSKLPKMMHNDTELAKINKKYLEWVTKDHSELQ